MMMALRLSSEVIAKMVMEWEAETGRDFLKLTGDERERVVLQMCLKNATPIASIEELVPISPRDDRQWEKGTLH